VKIATNENERSDNEEYDLYEVSDDGDYKIIMLILFLEFGTNIP